MLFDTLLEEEEREKLKTEEDKEKDRLEKEKEEQLGAQGATTSRRRR